LLEHVHELNTPNNDEQRQDIAHARSLLHEAETCIQFASPMIALTQVAEGWDQKTTSSRSLLGLGAPMSDLGLAGLELGALRQVANVGSPWGPLIAACAKLARLEAIFDELKKDVFQVGKYSDKLLAKFWEQGVGSNVPGCLINRTCESFSIIT
jgi:hypothetical protein